MGAQIYSFCMRTLEKCSIFLFQKFQLKGLAGSKKNCHAVLYLYTIYCTVLFGHCLNSFY